MARHKFYGGYSNINLSVVQYSNMKQKCIAFCWMSSQSKNNFKNLERNKLHVRRA